MLKERIRFKALHDRISDPATAAAHIQDGTNLFISGVVGLFMLIILFYKSAY